MDISTPSFSLADQIYLVMKEKERKRTYPESKQSEYFSKNRNLAISWLANQVVKSCPVQYTTIQMAVEYMDRLMSAYPEIAKVDKVAIVAFSLAIKSEEIFTLGNYSEIAVNYFSESSAPTPKELVDIEVAIITTLDWKLQVSTASHFVPYLTEVFSFSAKFKEKIEERVCFLIISGLKDYSFCQTTPSLLAAAALVLAVKEQNFSNKIFSALEAKSGHQRSKILEKVGELELFFKPPKSMSMEDEKKEKS